MNTYPIKNEKYTGEIRSYSAYGYMPIFEWGKKIYVLLDGQLTAFIPLCVAAARVWSSDDTRYGEYHTLIGAKVAGRGERIFFADRYRSNGNNRTLKITDLLFFETRDDYMRYLDGDNDATMSFPFVTPDEVMTTDLGFDISGDGHYRAPLQWVFDEDTGRPRRRGAWIKGLWIDEDGSHCEMFDTIKDNGKVLAVYPTEAACRMANIVPVVEFEDEKSEPDKPELTEFEDRLAEVIYDAIGECDPKVMDECCEQARKYSCELVKLAKKG